MTKHLERASTSVRVANVLRERIAGGTIAPGSRIIELEISRELGVSRSPVREALLRLAEEGLVKILPYRGAIVAPLQRDRLAELLDFRLALEHFALERFIDRGDSSAMGELRGHVVTMREALRSGDRKRVVDEDLAMHRTIIRLAGNELLERTYESLLAQIRLYIDATSARYEHAEDLATEHEAILDAIERKEHLMSRKLLDAHILHGFNDLFLEE